MARRSASGVTAERPSQFGWPAWRDVTKRAAGEVKEDSLSMVAAGVAFYLFLALFPAIAAGVSIYGLVADPADVQRALSGAAGVLPSQVVEILSQQMGKIAASSGSALGFGAILGILLALWSATKGTKALMEALNIVYEEHEGRGFLRLNAVALLLTLGVMVALVIAVAFVAVVPALLGRLGLPEMVQTVIAWARWPVLALLVMAGLAVFYRYAPSRQSPRWHWVSYGAVVATLLWLVASGLFSWYVSNSGSYNETYGSLAAIVILLMWFYISAFVVLFGAELNSEMEHQTARDTTTGEPVPLGQREATMADTVAGEATAEEGRKKPRRPARRHGPEPSEPAGVPQLAREIDETRRRIDTTLSALGERLGGEHLLDRTVGDLRRTNVAHRPADGARRTHPLLLGTLGAATGALLAATLGRRGQTPPRPH